MIRYIKRNICKIIATTVTAAFLLGIAMPVSAAGSYTARGMMSYAVGDELFTLLDLGEDIDAKSLIVDISSDDIERKNTGSVNRFSDSGNSVHYLFIVDASGSMKRYLGRINAFAEELYDSTESKSFYTLATFGERFDVIKEKMTDVNTLTHEIENVIYNEQYTDPYTAVVSAKTWLDSYDIKQGDIVEIILITDGEPDLKDKDRESKLADKAKESIEGSWGYIFNTLCTDEWTETAEDVFLSDDRGSHFTVKDEDEAKDAADSVSQSLDTLWFSETDLRDKAPDSFSYTFRMIGKDKEGKPLESLEPITFEGVYSLGSGSGGAAEEEDDQQEGPAPLDLPILPPGTEPSEEPEQQEPEQQTPETVEEPSEESSEEPEDETEVPSEDTEEPAEVNDEEPGSGSERDEKEHHTGLVAANTGGTILDRVIGSEYLPVFIAAAVAVLLIIIAVPVVIILVNVRKKKKLSASVAEQGSAGYSDTAYPVQKGPAEVLDGSVPMDIEVQAGLCLNVDRTVYILNEIRIGRDQGCDIVFNDPSLMPVQARIIRNGDDYIIEDFSNPSNVAIGGMRINGRNPLRSGDVITCGNIQFVLRF